MPANLTPEYMEAERRYREASTPEDKLACLEEMLSKIPKHKGTEKMQASLKRKISQFKQQAEAQRKKHKGFSHKIQKEGSGQIALIGPPNVGKSAFLAKVTNAEPEVADYPFTTHAPVPGMMPYLNITIQVVDLPPLSLEHTEPWVADLIKAADGVLLVCDLAASDPIAQMEETVEVLRGFGIDLVPPDRVVEPELRGVRKKGIAVANKIDLQEGRDMWDLVREMQEQSLPLVGISAMTGEGLENLKKRIYELLDIIRIYPKQPGKPADTQQPFTIHRNPTLIEFAELVHKDFRENLKYGRVWGSGKFDGQIVKHDHILQDEDIVELHL